MRRQFSNNRFLRFILFTSLLSVPLSAQGVFFDSTATDSSFRYVFVTGISGKKTSALSHYFQSELMLKVRLSQLMHHSCKRYLSHQQPLEVFAYEIDQLTLAQKNRLLRYAAMGSAGVYVLRLARSYLWRHGMSFIVPSLQGLALEHSIPPVQMNLRLAVLPDASYRLDSHFFRYKLSYQYCQHPKYSSHHGSFSPIKRFRFALAHTLYLNKYRINGFGLQYGRPNVFFYFWIENYTWLKNYRRYSVEFRLNRPW